jgi:hypothetical protein
MRSCWRAAARSRSSAASSRSPATTGIAMTASTTATMAAKISGRRERPRSNRAVMSAPQLVQMRPLACCSAPHAGQWRVRGANTAATSSRCAARAFAQGSSCCWSVMCAQSIYAFGTHGPRS